MVLSRPLKGILLFFSRYLLLCGLILACTTAIAQIPELNTEKNGVQLYTSQRSTIPALMVFPEENRTSVGEFSGWMNETFSGNTYLEWTSLRTEKGKKGQVHHKYQQTLNGVNVEGAVFTLHMESNQVARFSGDLYPDIQLNTTPGITEPVALDRALSYAGAEVYMWQDALEEQALKITTEDPNATYMPKGQLVVANDGIHFSPEQFKLLWKFDIYAKSPFARDFIYVDAQTGTFFQKISRLHHADVPATAQTRYSGSRTITSDSWSGQYRLRESGRGNGIETYDLNETPNFWAAVDFLDANNIWNNVNLQQDEVATDAHWGAEMFYDYFSTVHGRNSIDDAGYKLLNYIHYNVDHNDAFWDGQRMIYGDGDDIIYTPLTSVDVVGHEIAHGFTTYSSNLDSRNEPGALNESYSDIFGVLIDLWARPGVGNWVVADEVTVNGLGVRNLMNPSSLNHPDTYLGNNWDNTLSDIHNNSNVASHAFYLMSQGGTGTNDKGDSYTVTGIGATDAAAIAYRAQTVYLSTFSNFADARTYTIQSAIDLFGPCTPQVIAATDSWYAVGVGLPFFASVTADYTHVRNYYCAAPFTIEFENLSSNAGSYLWDFGDGNTSTDVDPVHTYTTPGIYTVTLIGDGGACGQDTMIKNGVVGVIPTYNCAYIMSPNDNNDVLTSCNGFMYDTGGPFDNYQDNINSTVTIAPFGAIGVDLNFSSFKMETRDTLYIYEGTDTTGPLIGKYSGTALPNGGTVSSPSGAITLLQTSDIWSNNVGFELTWSCVYGSVPPVANFIAESNTSCTGDIQFQDQSTGNPAMWSWDFGDGNTSSIANPLHTYTANGTYAVKLVVTNLNGADSLTRSAYVTINRPAAPTATGDQRCDPGQLTLTASATGTLNWYDSPTSTTILGMGTSFTTPVLNTSTMYYVGTSSPSPPSFVGPIDDNIGASGFLNTSTLEYLTFDAQQDLTIVSVWVNAQSTGNKLFILQDDQGNNITFSSFAITTPGPQRVTLNMFVPQGSNYRLAGRFMDFSYNTLGTNYPYSVPGLVSITGASVPNNYFFAYDWEVQGGDCISLRTPVLAEIGAGTITPSVSPAGPIDLCAGETVSLTAAGGTGWAWNNGDTTQSTTIASTGAYFVTVSDSGGCVGTSDSVFVTVYPYPTAAVSPSDTATVCPGDSVLLTASGGTAFLWDHGPTTAAVWVTPGSYSVIIEENGCADTSDVVGVGQFAPTASISGPTEICAGDSATLIASSGSSFLWSNGATSSTIRVGDPGSFTVTITDINGCEATSAPHIITIGAAPSAGITPSGTVDLCAGNGVTLTATGGNNYLWSTGSTSATLTVTNPGSYYVIAFNAGGCSDTSAVVTVTIHQPTANITPAGNLAFCPGDSVVLTANTGTNYLWSSGETTASITVRSSGTFTVSLTDSNGCSATSSSVTTTQNSQPVAQVSPAGPWILCPGDTLDLMASAGASFLWSDGATSQTNRIATPGAYSVVVTDGNGCRDTSTVDTAVASTPFAQITGDSVACPAGTANLTANSGSNYLWSTGATTQSIAVPTGSYFVTLTDSNGCVAPSPIFNVGVAPTPTPQITGDTAFCPGGSTFLTASGGMNYVWSTGDLIASITATAIGTYTVSAENTFGCRASTSVTLANHVPFAEVTVNGDTLICLGDSTQLEASPGTNYLWSTNESTSTISVSNVGSYSVSLTDTNGCFAVSDPVNISVGSNIIADINPPGTSAICPGDSILLTATGGNTYTWSTGQTGPSIFVSTPGNYQVEATTASGCVDTSDAVSISLYTPVATISGGNLACPGDSVPLTASTGSNFLWSNGDTGQQILAPPGGYTVTLTDSNGCEATSAVLVISAAPAPTATITPDTADQLCPGGGAIPLTAGGGVNYLWSTAATTPSITATSAGNYFVIAFDANGCRDTSNVVPITNFTPTADITPLGDTNICIGDSVQLVASSGSNYLWSTGQTGSSIFASSAGAYTVSLLDSNGCFATSDPIIVNATLGITATITPSGTNTICVGDSILLTGGGGSTYEWSDGQLGTAVYVNTAGTYYNVATSGSGCIDTSEVVTITLATPTASISGDTITCPGIPTSLTANPGTAYLWSNGDTTATSEVLPGSHTVTVFDAGGCAATSTVHVVAAYPAPPPVVVSSGVSILCPEDSTNLLASGGDTYLWSTGQIADSIRVPSGAYSVIGIDTNGCRDTSGIVNIAPHVPQATITGETTICGTDSALLVASPGTNYTWSTGQTNTDSIYVYSSGTYFVTLTDPNGCIAVAAPFAVTGGPTATASISPSGNVQVCPGDSVLLTAGGGSSYEWSSGELTSTIWASAPGNYTVIASTATLCADTSAPVTLTEYTPVATISGDNEVCSGQTTLLTASGGTAYLWSNGATTPIVSVGAGTYFVDVTDTNGCTGRSNNFDVSVPGGISNLILQPADTVELCPGTSVDLYVLEGGIVDTIVSAGNHDAFEDNNGSMDRNDDKIELGEKGWGGFLFRGINIPANATINSAFIELESDSDENDNPSSVTIYAHDQASANNFGNNNSNISNRTRTTTSVNWSFGPWVESNVYRSPDLSPIVQELVTSYGQFLDAKMAFLFEATGSKKREAVTRNASGTNNEPRLLIEWELAGNQYVWSTGDTTDTISVTQPGEYFISATQAGACVDTSEKVVVIAAQGFDAEILAPAFVCLGDSTSFASDTSTGLVFEWKFGDGATSSLPNPIHTYASGGTYTVTMTATEPGGCFATDTVFVDVSNTGLPLVDLGPDTTSCSLITLDLDAGNSGADYLWSTGDTSQVITVDTSGTYVVNVTTGFGCAATDSIDIVIESVTAVLNPGGIINLCAGSFIDLTVSGGDTYEWYNGFTGTTLDSVSGAGNFWVAAISANGCTDTAFYTINLLTSSNTISLNGDTVLCPGESISLTSSFGLAYDWSTGDTTRSIQTDSAGSYAVTLTDADGCLVSSDTVEITLDIPPVVSLAPTDTSFICAGDTQVLSASGAAQYLWSNGAITPSIAVVSNGAFSVIGTNANGCADTSTTATVLINMPMVSIQNLGDSVLCPGDSTDLMAGPGSNYVWSNGATSQTIRVGGLGQYSVTYSDTNGCTATTPSVAIFDAPVVTIGVAGAQDICPGDSVILVASGGSTYQWSTGSSNDSITVQSAGDYWVIGTAATGCSDTSSTQTITVLTPQVDIALLGDTALCPGEEVTLIAAIGTGYLWSNGATTDSITVDSGMTYSVTMTDTQGCTATSAPVIVIELPGPTPSISPAGPIGLCPGDSVTLTASGGGTYLWSNLEGTTSITVSTAGAYSVEVTDADGCSLTSVPVDITVNVPTAIISSDTNFCPGDTLTLSANTGSGYTWSNGDTTQTIEITQPGTYQVSLTDSNGCAASSQPFNTFLFTPPIAQATALGTTAFCPGDSVRLAASGGISTEWSTGALTDSILTSVSGTYYAVVTDTNGCRDTSNMIPVTVFTPQADISGDSLVCPGDSIILTANTGSNYLWSTGETTQSITVGSSGTYTVTLTDANGCQAGPGVKTVTISTPPTATITPAGSLQVCNNQPVTLTAGGGSAYVWSTGQVGPTLTVFLAGDYYVIASDSSGGCSDTSAVFTLTTVVPSGTISASDSTGLCPGDTTFLTASAGSGYLWSGGEISPSLAVTVPGTYSVIFNDTNGCLSIADYQVNPGVVPVAGISPTDTTVVCPGQSALFVGSGGSTYEWSNGVTTSSLIAITPGDYFVEVTSSDGCTDTSATVTLTNHIPAASISPAGSASICPGDSVTLTAGSGSNFLWSSGQTGQSISVTTAGLFTVSMLDSNGCFATSQPVTVTQLNPPIAFITPAVQLGICPGDSALLTGNGGATYIWSTGDTGPTLWVDTLDNYFVIATDTNGCSDTSDIRTPVFFTPQASIATGGPTTFCPGDSVTLLASTGTNFLWSNGETTQQIYAGQSGNYSVAFDDPNGCAVTAGPVTVTLTTPPVATISPTGNTDICPGNTQQFSATGGASYLWNTGASGSTIFASQAGMYQVVVTDTNGCRDSASATLGQFVPQATVSAGGPTVFCQGDSVVLTASAGTGYLWTTGETTASITVYDPGAYAVSLTDPNGCLATSAPVFVTIQQAPTATLFPGGNRSICPGDSVVLTGSGGNTYLWSSGDTGPNLTVTAPGNYYVIATNGVGCSDTSAVSTIGLFTPQSSVSPSGPLTICPGIPTTLTAGPGSDFLWSTGATSPTLSVSNAGNYSLTLTDPNGCRATSAPVVVNEFVPPTAAVTPAGAQQICPGDSLQLTATGGVSYNWSHGPTTGLITLLGPGNYFVEVTDGNGCKDTSAAVTVSFHTPSATILPFGATTICPDDSVLLGASAGSNYLWSTGDTTATIYAQGAGVYGLSLTDSNGCTASATPVTIDYHTLPAAAITPAGGASICPGDSLQVSGSGGLLYEWSHGPSGANQSLSTPGSYTVRVTDGNGCKDTSAAFILNHHIPTASILPSGNVDMCPGDTLILSTNAGSSHVWSTGFVGPTLAVTDSGSYSVSLIDSNGCSATSSPVNVSLLPGPLGTITNFGPTSFCPGDSVLLIASGGTSYLWSTGDTGPLLPVFTTGNFSVIVSDGSGCSDTTGFVATSVFNLYASVNPAGPLTFCEGDSVTLTASPGLGYSWSTGELGSAIVVDSTGQYSVTVIDTNGCMDVLPPVNVTVSPTPVASVSPSGVINICPGDQVTLFASGGVGYQWSTGATTSNLSVSTSGNFYVVATNSDGCTDTSDVVRVRFHNPRADVTPTGPENLCAGDSILLSAGPGTNYLWSTGETSNSIWVSTSGSYTVSLTDTNGCNAFSNPVNVINNAAPQALIIPGDTFIICPGDSVVLQTGFGTDYQWSSGDTTQQITVGAAGVYTVSFLHQNGCETPVSDPTVVSVSTVLPAVVTPMGPTGICPGDSITLHATGGSSFDWSNGDSGDSIRVTDPGNYFFISTNIHGCMDTSAVTTVFHHRVNATITGPPTGTICDGDTTQLIAGPPGMNYAWNTGSSDSLIDVSDPGIYWVVVTDSNGCADTSGNYTLKVNPTPVADFFWNSNGLNAFFTDLSSPFTWFWEWDFGDGDFSTSQHPTHTYDSSGTYVVTLIATAAGCSDTAQLTVNVIGTGVDELTGPNALEVLGIYPNPFSTELHIRLNLPEAGELQAELVSMVGRRSIPVYAGSASAGRFELDWEMDKAVADGMYLLVLRFGDQVVKRKLVHLKE